MSTVLPQLLEVDSELSAQATALEAQLTELQEKRKGIQTVIAMFESGNAPDISDIAAVTSTSDKKSTTRKTAGTATRRTTAKAKGKTTKAKRGRPAKAKAASASSSTEKKSSEKKAAGKRSGRTANWQRYVQESYRKDALPEVIGGVLQAQPGNVFKIADVMNAVFKEDMPKNHFLKARNRVSNILSAGAREGTWYRGRGGTYSVSEKAVKAS